MKYLLIVAGLIASEAVSAQKIDYSDFQKRSELLDKLKKQPVALPAPRPGWKELKHGNTPEDKFMQRLSSGTTVTLLPQDNMPCLLPVIEINNMPNPGKNIKILTTGPGVMPNGAKPRV